MLFQCFGQSLSGVFSDECAPLVMVLADSATGVTYEGRDLEALSTVRRYREWIIDHFRPFLSGNAVEFGAGTGNFAQHIFDHVTILDLVEPSPNLVAHLRERFHSKSNVTVIDGTLEHVVRNMKDAQYECILMVNVLEHIENDIDAVRECYRILKPGGRLLILVPALPFLYSELDRLVGHFRRYDKSGLHAVLESGGMTLNKLCYFDFLGIWPWWVLNTLGGATAFNATLVKIYDAVFVPVSRFIECWRPPPIGKSLVAIASRPEVSAKSFTRISEA